MFISYIDESGTPQAHHEPLVNGETPIFVLACLVFNSNRWRILDRSYCSLKTKFFQKEIGQKRPEQFEIKGNEIIGPHNKDSRRRHTFCKQAMKICMQNEGKGFAVIIRKDPINPMSPTSMYTMALQYLVERVHCWMEEAANINSDGVDTNDAHTVIIADSRMNNLDLKVAVSHLSFIFGNPSGQRCASIIEAPTFTFSQLSVGIQLTDIFASGLYAHAYRMNCSKIANALDYSHMDYFDEFRSQFEFRSQRWQSGYQTRGYRFINLNESS